MRMMRNSVPTLRNSLLALAIVVACSPDVTVPQFQSNTAPTPTNLTITTQPSATAQGGVPFAQQPVLQLRDINGGAVAQAGVVVTAAMATGIGTLGGTATATTNANGVAAFTNLSLIGADGSRTLSFNAPLLAGATSSTIVLTTPAPSASQLAMAAQPSASALGGVAFGQQPVIQLRDATNAPVNTSGVVVTAAIATGGGTLGGTLTATTNATGAATFTNLSITGADGARTLAFSSPGLTGATSSSISVVTPPPPPTATQVAITTQPSTSVPSGTAFPQQPVVQLRDATNAAVSQSGVVVTAAIATGAGTLGGTLTATTNASGVATFTNLTITGAVGARTLRFSVTGLTSATSGTIAITAPPATQVAMATQPSAAAQSGVALAQQPAVQLEDASSAAVSQAGVVVTAAIASGGGTLGGTLTATTNASGVATFTNLSITGVNGVRTLSFSASGLTTATSSSITVTSAPPPPGATQVAITTQPSASAQSGVVLAQQPVVQLQDASNAAVSQSGVVITAAIATGGGTLGGTLTATTNASGVATFTNLSITGATGSRTLVFTSPGLTSATSSAIAVTAPTATQLTITTQPSTTAQGGVVFARQPVIQLRDASNAAVSQSGVVVTAAIATGGGTLAGTLTATTNASGVATFTNLSITGADGARTLSFSATGLTGATSGSVSVTTPPPATQLSITTQPSATAQGGVAFAQQPVLQLRDASNAAVSQSGVVVTAAIATGGGTLGGTLTATTNASGVATFTNLSITGADGARTLSFSAPSLTGVASGSISVTTPPPGSSCPNEPAGYTTFNEQPWDVSPARLVRTSQGWIDDDGDATTKLQIITDATSPYQPSSNHNVVSALFNAGNPGGSAPFYVYRPFASTEQYKSMYICMYVKHETGFDNTNGNAMTKFMWPAGDAVQGTQVFMAHEAPQMYFSVIQQGTVDRTLGANLNTSAAQLDGKRGSWVRYELLLKANSANGSANGELHVWLDGVKTHQYTNVNWQMGSGRAWQSLAWNPTYGGGTNPIPKDQHQYIDHIHVSGGP